MQSITVVLQVFCVSFLLSGAIAFDLGDAKVANWRRDRANEFAMVSPSERLILMSSSDHARLPNHVIPSVSLHDFGAKSMNGKGLVALKLFGSRDVCAITEVAKSYEETEEELRRRSKLQEPLPIARAQSLYKPVAKVGLEELAMRSVELAEFCSGSNVYLLEKSPFDPTVPRPWYPWWRTWCIWIEYPIDIQSIEEYTPLGY